jgi:hypothetical protein
VFAFVLVRGRGYLSSLLGHYKRHLLAWLALDRTGLHSVEFVKRLGFNGFWPTGLGLCFGFGSGTMNPDVDSIVCDRGPLHDEISSRERMKAVHRICRNPTPNLPAVSCAGFGSPTCSIYIKLPKSAFVGGWSSG